MKWNNHFLDIRFTQASDWFDEQNNQKLLLFRKIQRDMNNVYNILNFI